jgi:beta-mannosidase
MFSSLWKVLPIFLTVRIALAQHTVNFSDLKWHLTNSDGNVSIPASFPSQSHLDLYAAGVIADPLYGMGDFDQLWVQRANWTYSTTLSGL